MSTTMARCHYIIGASYEGKKPFCIFASWLVIERAATKEETENAALSKSSTAVARFWDEHFPDGTIPPHVISVHLGAMIMTPDDYEWRRM